MGQAKIDGDLILACLARNNGATLAGDHGVMYAPYYKRVERKFIGAVKMPSGVLSPAAFFYRLEQWQVDHAKRLVHMLNDDLHHDGAWSVLWTNPTAQGQPTELHIAYQDVDGDIRFVIESTRSLVDLMMSGPESHMENCERAFQECMGWTREVDIRPDQTIKAGQGQQSVNPNIKPII